MSNEVDVPWYNTIYLAPGAIANWNFWANQGYDGYHWSRISALPLPASPDGSSIQILAEWATKDALHVTFKNNGNVGVLFQPRGLIAPNK